MPTIEVTQSQYEYVEALRALLETELVGRYGRVAQPDAVQFLIDHFDAAAMPETIDPESLPVAEPGPIQVEDGDIAVDEPADPSDDDGNETTDDGEDETADSDGEDGTADSDEDGETVDEDGEETADEEIAYDETEVTEDEDSEDDGAEPEDPESRLEAMMNLLDVHDEKWSDGEGDHRYVVELPDGTTEGVQTKDDVRALLFRHYR